MKNKNIQYLRQLAIICLVTLISVVSFSQEERFHKRLLSTPTSILQVGDIETVFIEDNLASNNNLSVEDFISLGIDHNWTEIISTPYQLEVDVTVTPLNGTPFLITLSVDYYPNKRQTYKDLDTYVFQGVEQYDFTISDVRVNGTTAQQLPKNVYIDGDILVNRAFDFTSQATIPMQFVTISGNDLDCPDPNLPSIPDEIEITWNVVPGAIEYQLEWTFINDYKLASNGTITNIPSQFLKYDFRENNTRITTKNTVYKIPLVFERGWVLFRVRAVGKDLNHTGRYMFGVWSTDQVSGNYEKGNVLDFEQNNLNASFHVVNPHEENKNWQITTTFAEEGKKKEVVSYYDGSLRNRQSVTVVNTDNNVIVGETVYDHQGRPAVNILPVPVFADQTNCSDPNNPAQSKIQYYPLFNQSTSGGAYSRDDFDLDPGSCSTSTNPLATDAGAGLYYGPNNPNQTDEQSYIPDANGYPFTVVEYTPDNTGRIRRQSGVGEDFKLGTNHETKYFYGKPDQIQLDRLFASEVGYAEHYKKNMVIDPNGQISVSYLDQEGRVVATSLAGEKPANLNALDSYSSSTVTLHDEMITENEGTLTDQGNVNDMEFSQVILVSKASTYSFAYDMSSDVYTDDCFPNICFNCYYDLEISITDDCGSILYSHTVTNGNFIQNDQGEFVFSENCQGGLTDALTFDVDLDVGNYNLNKKLTVNTEAAEYYIDNVLLDSVKNTCFQTLYDFQVEALNNIDLSDCNIDCQACYDDLGDKDDFIAAGRGTAADYDALYADCDEMCKEPTYCQTIYEVMLGDVSPGGQYAKYEDVNYSVTPSLFPLSVLNTSNVLGTGSNWQHPQTLINGNYESHYYDDNDNIVYVVNSNGNMVEPHQLTLQEFVDNWQESWARALVIYHPEYCYYKECIKLEEEDANGLSSEEFDAQLRAMSLADAYTNGYLQLNALSNLYEFKIEDYDPFFTNSNYTSLAGTFQAALSNYQYVNGQGKSYGQIASLITYHGNQQVANSSIPSSYFDFIGTPNQITGADEQAWNMAVALYLGKKLEILNTEWDQNAIANGCFNDCIGNDDFNPYAKGFYQFNSFPNIYSNPYYDQNQPCSAQKRWLYKDKQKRFSDVLMDLDYDPNQINYNLYSQTGLCPAAYNFQALLNQIAFNGDLLNSINLLDYGTYAGLIIALNNNEIVDPLPPSNYSANTTSQSSIGIDVTSGTSSCTTTLITQDGSSIDWTLVTGFSQMFNVTENGGITSFEITATVVTPVVNPDGTTTNVTTYVPLYGSTCYPLANCNFAPQCSPNDLGREIQDVISFVSGNQQITSSSYLLTNFPAPLSQIGNLLGSINTLTYSYNPTGSYSRISNTNGDYIQLTITALIEEPGESFSNSSYFDEFTSAYENNFSFKARRSTGALVATVEGYATFYDNQTMTSSELNIGNCASPTNLLCNTPEHQNLFDLQALFTPELFANPNAIDIYGSSNFSTSLSSYAPGITHTTSNETIGTNDITLTIDNGDCDIVLSAPLTLGTFGNITTVFDVQGSGTPTANNYYEFTIDAGFQISAMSIEQPVTITGTSCIPLKNCEDCNNSLIIGSDKSMDTLIAHGKAFRDTSIFVYQKMTALIDSINTTYNYTVGHPNRIEVANYADLRSTKMSQFVPAYVKALESYNPKTDTALVLDSIQKFAVKNGNCINVKVQFERYNRALALYNEKAALNNQPALTPVTFNYFANNQLACHLDVYLKHLDTSLVSSSIPAQNTTSFFTNMGLIQTFNPADSCNALYQDYVIAYEYYLANNTNAQYCSYYVQLVTMEEITANNLCYDSSSLQVFSDYINSFYDLNNCPDPLPFYNIKTHTTTTTIDPCVQQQALFYTLIDDFNSSDYAITNNVNLNPSVPVEELPCECLPDYLNYLSQYLVTPTDYSLPVPIDISKYNCREQANDCYSIELQYNELVGLFLNQLKKNFSSFPNGYQLPGMFDKGVFVDLDLCNCYAGFEAHLNYLMDNGFPNGFPTNDEMNILTYCADMPCTPDAPAPIVEDVEVEYENPCEQNLTNIAMANAENAFNEYVEQLRTEFLENYIHHCESALNESFSKEYDFQEFHYTLYYYDQAGNLIKTVPPEGVEILGLDVTSDPNGDLANQIISDRNNHEQTVFTNHRLATKYMYNSLNQLVKQSLPDHDQMDVWNATLPNGLDANLQIEEIQYLNANQGYLIGNVTHGNYTRGMLYSTSNGGKNWTRVNDLIASSIYAVHPVTFNNTTLLYAVGEHGTLLVSSNNGSSWDLIPLVENGNVIQSTLLDFTFNSTTNDMVIVGMESTVVKYNLNSSPTTTLSVPNNSGATDWDFAPTDIFNSIDFDGTEYTLSVNKLYNGKRIGVLYTSTDGSNWTPVSEMTTENLNTVQLLSSSAKIGGDKGLLLSSDDTGNNWYVNETEITGNITKIVYADDNTGVLLIDDKLYYTLDGGKTVTLLDNADNYSQLKFAGTRSNGVYAIATTNSDKVSKIIIPFGGVATIDKQNINISSTFPTSLTDATIHTSSTNQPAMAVDGSNNVYYTSNFTQSGGSNWQIASLPASLANVSFEKIDAVKYGNTFLGVLVSTTGMAYSFEFDLSTAQFDATNFIQLSPTDVYTKTTVLYPSTLTVYNSTQNSLESIDYSSGYTSTTSSTPLSPTTLATDFATDGSTVMLMDYSGAITKLIGTTETDLSNNVRPLPLNRLDKNSTTTLAAGVNGNFVEYSNSTPPVVVKRTDSRADLYDVAYQNTNTALFVGQQGAAISYNGLTQTAISLPTTEDLYSIDINQAISTKSVIAGANGTMLYSQGTGNNYQLLVSNEGENLYAASVTSLGKTVFAGKNSHVLFGTSSFVIATKQVFPGELTGVNFYDNNHGAVVGKDGFFARTTATGGQNFYALHNATSQVLTGVASTPNNVVLIGDGGFIQKANYSAYTLNPVSFTPPSTAPTTTLNDIHILGNNGYAVGDNIILKTTDGGNNWNSINATVNLKNMHYFGHNNSFVAVSDGGVYSFNPTTQTLSGILAASPNGVVFNDIAFYDDAIGYVVGDNDYLAKAINVQWNNPTERIITGLGLDPKTISSTGNSIRSIAVAERYNFMIGGNNASTTKYAELIADESEEFSTYFYYDKLGRIVVSQNSRQYAETPKKYSYTLYDGLGRVVEAGEKEENQTSGGFETIFGSVVSNLYNPKVIDDTKLLTWVTGDGPRREVTHSYYDIINPNIQANLPAGFSQNTLNLRKRISAVTYEDVYDGNDGTYDYATHYDYDIHGNVKTILQDNKKLFDENPNNASIQAMQFKRMDYLYDLISGNVNEVSYQKGEPDQWHHRYTYDGDNRIKTVETSDDYINWFEDVRYFYYDHGPLARVELGEHNVQGIDYAYTLQGWLKGVNSDLLDPSKDIGKDGDYSTTSNLNQFIARDAFGFSLNYYSNDYTPINTQFTGTTAFNTDITNSDVASNTGDLYNGNIGAMVTTIKKPIDHSNGANSVANIYPQATAYQYDQLNRLIESKAFANVDNSTNAWQQSTNNYDGRYYNAFTYDANGNIITQKRKDQAGTFIDELTYHYAEINGKKVQNRLYHVNDNYDYDDNDIDDMGTFNASIQGINSSNNYSYDPTGQLIQDLQEDIASIDWRVDGKIHAIIRTPGSMKKNMIFDYDPMGNRIAKHVYGNQNFPATGTATFDPNAAQPPGWEKSTYYNRDAQGNVMAIYEYSVDNTNPNNPTTSFKLAERNIYGSSRVGMNKKQKEMIGATLTVNNHIYHQIGKKEYELSNHLGNVLSVISDRKYAIDADNDNQVDYFEPDVLLTYDYSPFGVILTERNFEKQVCYDTTYQQIITDMFSDFEDGTAQGWFVNANINTLSVTNGGKLKVKETGQNSNELKAKKIVTLTSGITYNFSIDYNTNGLYANGNQNGNKGIMIMLKDVSGNQQPITLAGFLVGNSNFSMQFSVPTTGSWKLVVQAVKNGNNTFNKKFFKIDNVSITHEVTVNETVCNSYGDYRYSFQGQERDDEIKGAGNSYNYKYRMHDPRLGRFFAVDPLTKKYPHYTPYSFSGNKVIAFRELEGLEESKATGAAESIETKQFESGQPIPGSDYYPVNYPGFVLDESRSYKFYTNPTGNYTGSGVPTKNFVQYGAWETTSVDKKSSITNNAEGSQTQIGKVKYGVLIGIPINTAGTAPIPPKLLSDINTMVGLPQKGIPKTEASDPVALDDIVIGPEYNSPTERVTTIFGGNLVNSVTTQVDKVTVLQFQTSLPDTPDNRAMIMSTFERIRNSLPNPTLVEMDPNIKFNDPASGTFVTPGTANRTTTTKSTETTTTITTTTENFNSKL